MSFGIGLTHEERGKARDFSQRLKETDLAHVRRVVHSVDALAHDYFSSGQQNENYWAFCDLTRVGTPFFAVYLIGGYTTKAGDRPDIDLLVAANMRWTTGFLNDDEFAREPEDWDPMWRTLTTEFGDGYAVQRAAELPNDYNLGVTQGKVLITLTPPEGKKLDINYVRSWSHKGFSFIDEQQFSQLDVGKAGEPLSRLPLYRATSTVIVPQLRF